jgi:hypothetical protein
MSRVALAGIAAVVLSIAATPADAGWRKRGWWGPAPIVAAPIITPQVFVPAPVVTYVPAPVFQQVIPAPVVVSPSVGWAAPTPFVTATPTVTWAPQQFPVVTTAPTIVAPAPTVVGPAPVTLGWVSTRPNCGVYGYWNGGGCMDARFDPPVLARNW